MTLIERLRLGGPNAMEVAGEAADEIERLQQALLDFAGRADSYGPAMYALGGAARNAVATQTASEPTTSQRGEKP